MTQPYPESLVHDRTEAEWDTLLARLLEMGLRDGDRILDAGTGLCRTSVALAERLPGSVFEAVVASTLEAAHARAHVRRARFEPRISVRSIVGGRLPSPNDRFDLALAIDVGPQTLGDAAWLSEIWRTLRPRSWLYLRCTTEERDVADTPDVSALDGAGFIAVEARRSHTSTMLVRRLPRRRIERAHLVRWEVVARKRWTDA